MRTTIYIPGDLVKEIDEAAWMLRKNRSEYFVDLHRRHVEKMKTKDKLLQEKISSVPSSEEIKVGKVEDYELGIQIDKDFKASGMRPKYSQKYKDANPNERCDCCLKAVKFCDCEVAK